MEDSLKVERALTKRYRKKEAMKTADEQNVASVFISQMKGEDK